MLRKLAILFLTFLTTAVMAQTAPAAPAKKPAAKKPASAASKPATKTPAALTDNSPILFVPGLCNIPATAPVPAAVVPPKPGAPPESKCMRQVTKKQFEILVKSLGPGAANADPTKLADYYARALAIENQGRKMNLDADPTAREVLWMARVKAMADLIHTRLQEQNSNVPDSELQAYYDQHKPDYEEATIEGVIIPKPSPTDKATTPPAKEGAAPESPSAAKAGAPLTAEPPYADRLAAAKANADKILERAKAGEDLAKLQKEAFAGMPGKVPDLEPMTLRRTMVPPQQQATLDKIIALQPGQYSPIIEESKAFVFYKLVSKHLVPLDQVKNEIKEKLATDKEDAAVDKFFSESRPVMVQEYFAPPKPEQPAEGAKPEAQPQAAPPEQPKAEQPQPPAPKQENPNEPPKQEQSSAPPK